jgi:hypothetical protein
MKLTITINTEDSFEKDAILNATENKIKLDSLYDVVFRPIIRYSQDESEVKSYELVWDKLSKYLNDEL